MHTHKFFSSKSLRGVFCIIYCPNWIFFIDITHTASVIFHYPNSTRSDAKHPCQPHLFMFTQEVQENDLRDLPLLKFPKDGNPTFSHDTLGYDDAPLYQVWMHTVPWFGRYLMDKGVTHGETDRRTSWFQYLKKSLKQIKKIIHFIIPFWKFVPPYLGWLID